MNTKTCAACNIELPLEEFGVKDNHKGKKYYNSRCRPCHNKYGQERWWGNRKERKDSGEFICNYLLAHPCVDCGESDIQCLEFDHVNGQKSFGIAQARMACASVEKIAAEIKKCEVRCANCHRRRTAKNRNHFRYKFLIENGLLIP